MYKIPLRKQISTLVINDLTFLRRFLTNPSQIGSITPSSHYLVHDMLSMANWQNVKNVAELGAGTGVLTEEIVKKLRADAKLCVFELDGELRNKIEKSLHLHVYNDARSLPEVVLPGSLDLVISSLPWTTLPQQMTIEILNGILFSLKPNGQFIAYQYSPQMLSCFRKLFKSVKMSFVLPNIPPAFIYNCNFLQNEFYGKKIPDCSKYLLSQGKGA